MECSREESVRESESEDDGVERDLMQYCCLTRWQCVAIERKQIRTQLYLIKIQHSTIKK